MNQSEFDELDRIISSWPGVDREKTTQIAYLVAGHKFCWLSPGSRMVQISPPLGPRCITRRLEHVRNEARVIHQKTGWVDAVYNDPGSRLIERWSYPGFMGSEATLSQAIYLIRQSYERLRTGPKVLSTSEG